LFVEHNACTTPFLGEAGNEEESALNEGC